MVKTRRGTETSRVAAATTATTWRHWIYGGMVKAEPGVNGLAGYEYHRRIIQNCSDGQKNERVEVLVGCARWHSEQIGRPSADAYGAYHWRLHRIHFMSNDTTTFYEGPPEKERLVRREYANGDVSYFEGDRDRERLVAKHFCDENNWQHYEGEKGEERLVEQVLQKRPWERTHHYFYEGEKDMERIVRREHCGVTYFYEGEKGKERLVRDEQLCYWTRHPVLEKSYYEGERGEELMVRREFPCGKVQHYEGEWDEEHMVREEGACEDKTIVKHFEGPKGEERLVRYEKPTPDGNIVLHFEGPKDEERHVRTTFPDGSVSIVSQ